MFTEIIVPDRHKKQSFLKRDSDCTNLGCGFTEPVVLLVPACTIQGQTIDVHPFLYGQRNKLLDHV